MTGMNGAGAAANLRDIAAAPQKLPAINTQPERR
jgi:hypothetical protein